jgi:hypothetical protein
MTSKTRTDAVIACRQRMRAALAFYTDDLKPAALARERQRRIDAARADLLKVAPGETTGTDAAERADRLQAEALAGLAVYDANSVAVAQNEYAKLERALARGANLELLIREAPRPRLAAIADRMDDLAAESVDPEGASRELREMVLARLAALGDAKASEARSVAAEAQTDAAWSAYIAQTAERGEVGYGVAAALYLVDPDAHASLVAADPLNPGLDLPTALGRAEREALSAHDA